MNFSWKHNKLRTQWQQNVYQIPHKKVEKQICNTFSKRCEMLSKKFSHPVSCVCCRIYVLQGGIHVWASGGGEQQSPILRTCLYPALVSFCGTAQVGSCRGCSLHYYMYEVLTPCKSHGSVKLWTKQTRSPSLELTTAQGENHINEWPDDYIVKNWETCYRGGVQRALRASGEKHQVGIVKKTGCLNFKLKDKNIAPGKCNNTFKGPGEGRGPPVKTGA